MSNSLLTLLLTKNPQISGDSDQRARLPLELNCSARMQRSLGSYVKASDRAGFVPKPSDWGRVPPEGYEANLQKILCPK